MDFALSDEEKMIADMARAFFADNATSERTRAAMDAAGFDRALWAQFAGELGLAGIIVPEAYGGAGLGMVTLALVAEAAGYTVAALPLLGHVMALNALVEGGSHAQKARWLSRLATGELVAATGYARGVQAAEGRLHATLDFVPHGAVADVLVALGEDRVWLVDMEGPGVSVTQHVSMDQTRPLATIDLVDVPAERLEGGAAARSAAEAVGWLYLSSEALGGAQGTLDRTVSYAKERVQFGRPIGSFQAYKHRLADMMVEIEQARSAVFWAACAVDEQSHEAPLALHAAKAFCADTYRLCAGNMIQLHGGIGFTWEHDTHLFFKRARSVGSMLGDSDAHRRAIAGIVIGEAA